MIQPTVYYCLWKHFLHRKNFDGNFLLVKHVLVPPLKLYISLQIKYSVAITMLKKCLQSLHGSDSWSWVMYMYNLVWNYLVLNFSQV